MTNIFMIDLLGKEISQEEVELLKNPYVGGIVLFAKNYSDPAQLRNLIDSIRSIRTELIIAVDHEGGFVQRFVRHALRALPSARVYGDIYDINPDTALKFAKQYGKVMAQDLKELGVDISLAPVLDLHDVSDVIGKLDRAFHRDPEVVTQIARAFIQGMNTAGFPGVGKHFPGHGSVKLDSHVEKPVLARTREELFENDIKPFSILISEGLLSVVMPAHVVYTSLDPNNPAGFSEICLKEILRETLHFQGLVMSDCLGMAGADIGDMVARAQSAHRAGCDMLIVCNQLREVLRELLNAITIEQTSESADRINALRNSLWRFAQKPEVNSTTMKETLAFRLFDSNNIEVPVAGAASDVGSVEYNTTKTI